MQLESPYHVKIHSNSLVLVCTQQKSRIGKLIEKEKNVCLLIVENRSNYPRFIWQSGWYFQETFLSLKIRGL